MTIELLTQDHYRVKIFKALAEVKRIEIIRYLYHHQGAHSCGEIEVSLNMSPTTLKSYRKQG